MSVLGNILKVKVTNENSFENIAEKWLDDKRNNIKQSTYSNYEYMIKKYLIPHLQGKKINQLEKVDFNQVVESLNYKLSPKTVRDIVSILKSISFFIEGEYSCKLKMSKIKYPKQNHSNVETFCDKDRKKIESYCVKSKDIRNLGICLCFNTGIRIGELCALKWNCIDLEKRIISIKYTLERIYDTNDPNNRKTKIIMGEPKTKNSIREIPISDKLYRVLKPLSGKYDKDSFFLTGSKKKFIEPRSYERIYKNIIKKCQVPPNKFHAIRHTFATNCIDVGMDAKSLSEILGHSTVNITLNTYVHSSYEMKKKYLEKI